MERDVTYNTRALCSLRALRTLDAIADMAMAMGEIQRQTAHVDGRTRETNSTHTLMLALAVVELCPPDLDCALAVQFALVHDLPEVLTAVPTGIPPYKSDVDTSVAFDAKAKAAAEDHAVTSMHDNLTLQGAHRLSRRLLEYERLSQPWACADGAAEAQFVRYLDKILPKVTHSLNGGGRLRNKGTLWSALFRHHDTQFDRLRTDYPDTHKRLGLVLSLAMDRVEALLWAECATVDRMGSGHHHATEDAP